jgi:hypothetical protein
MKYQRLSGFKAHLDLVQACQVCGPWSFMLLSHNILMFTKFYLPSYYFCCTIHPPPQKKNTVKTIYKEYFTALRFSVLKNTQVKNYERNGIVHVAAQSAELDFGFFPPAMIDPL